MFTFGSDPEFMIKDKDYVSAIGILPPQESKIQVGNNAFYRDGVMAEASLAVCKTKEDAVENIRELVSTFSMMVSPYNIVLQAAQKYSDEALNNDEARTAGCSSSIDSYTMMEVGSKAAQLFKTSNLRTAAGHIHCGHPSLLEGGNAIIFAMAMDLFLVHPSILMDKDTTSAKRRTLYGKAGDIRICPYGVEIRAITNFWMRSPELVSLTYDITRFVVELVESKKAEQIFSFSMDKFYECVDDCREPGEAWTAIFDKFDLSNAINNCIFNDDLFKIAKIFMPTSLTNRVIDQFDKNDREFYKNWGIK